jgi:hypothetical protein
MMVNTKSCGVQGTCRHLKVTGECSAWFCDSCSRCGEVYDMTSSTTRSSTVSGWPLLLVAMWPAAGKVPHRLEHRTHLAVARLHRCLLQARQLASQWSGLCHTGWWHNPTAGRAGLGRHRPAGQLKRWGLPLSARCCRRWGCSLWQCRQPVTAAAKVCPGLEGLGRGARGCRL